MERLLGAGMWIGAHSHRHVPACAFDAAGFRRQVAACRRFLVALGMPLTWAYPGGHPGSFGAEHERVLLDHGFRLRFSTLEGPCRLETPEAVQGRYVIRRGATPRYVRAALAGGLGLVRWCKRLHAAAGAGRGGVS